ncbi:MAG: type 4a pilus biogenesis protein PilO [Thermoanaerobaculia bacterium]
MILGVLDDLLDRPAKQKFAGLGAVLVALAVLDWQYWYGPRQRELAELQSQVSERQAELDSKRSKANLKDEAEREIRDLGAELKRAEARLPDQREIADLLSSVADSARASGLELVLFRQKPEVARDFYAEVPVEMQMRGTYHEVAMFLDRVKRLDRVVNVSDIKLTKPKVEGERVALEAACTALTFRFLDESERRTLEEQKKKDGKKGGEKTT